LLKNIEKGESKIQRIEEMGSALDIKVKRYKNPWLELTLTYGQSKGKAYTEDEDRFLVCMIQKLGYGRWDELKLEIRKAWQFRFDWFLKSRSPLELNRRVDVLIRLIEKENQEIKEKEKEARKVRYSKVDCLGLTLCRKNQTKEKHQPRKRKKKSQSLP
jgi:SWI/SNF-related matrix-associated actin-dependent regulator of chromatin subfamily A member 5